MKRKLGSVLLVCVLTAGMYVAGAEAEQGQMLINGAVVVASEMAEESVTSENVVLEVVEDSTVIVGAADVETAVMDSVEVELPVEETTVRETNTPVAKPVFIQDMPGNDFAVNMIHDEEIIIADTVLGTGASEIDEEISASVDGESNEEEATEESEYANLAIADVNDYVNVRSMPNTDGEIVGKIYDGAVAQIVNTAGENYDWFQIVSGNVEGYIKAEFFIYGEAAAAVVDEYVTRYALVQADRLNVRKAPDIGAARIGYVDFEEKVKLLEDCGDWLKVQYTDNNAGYVAAEYVTIVEEFTYAKSIEEERAELEAERELAARQEISEQTAPENTFSVEPPQTDYTTNSELRASIVEYAMQYLGNVYIHGGQSLADGTDCSGFTCYIYKDFGYSISRTPSGQLSSAGSSIDYSEIQPGDIICYTSNGGKSCTHVGLYIGDGQIIHAANSRKGVIISDADYSTIMGVKNVID